MKQAVLTSKVSITGSAEKALQNRSIRCLILKALLMRKQKRTFEGYGGIAQLGEHLLCKQGVSGSIPLISTRGLNDSEK